MGRQIVLMPVKLTIEMDLDIPAIEAKWKKFWTENDIYDYDTTVRDRNKWFSIDTPPPTISGKMHMGHAFSYPHQDFIARYKRMRGYQVYYPWGFDDNGLPTERYTEKALGIKGERTELRERFPRKAIGAWRVKSGIRRYPVKGFCALPGHTQCLSPFALYGEWPLWQQGG